MRTIIYLLIIILMGQFHLSECTADTLFFGRGRVPEEVITNPSQSDGFGSQFQTIIASVIYAELHNKRYVYTPFGLMEHNYTNDPYFIAKKEELINFINNFETIDSNSHYSVTASVNYKAFFDANVGICANSRALEKIKRIFRANKDKRNYFNDENLHIAIHVRRPNSHDNRIMGTNTSDTVFMNIINKLRMIYTAQNPLFHLYSQGKSENFSRFNAPDVILHLDESVEDTFCAMVFADILVTAASSFSYTAALLSEGIVYYLPFWHAPLPQWITVDALLQEK